jgi:hypothetical protein
MIDREQLNATPTRGHNPKKAFPPDLGRVPALAALPPALERSTVGVRSRHLEAPDGHEESRSAKKGGNDWGNAMATATVELVRCVDDHDRTGDLTMRSSPPGPVEAVPPAWKASHGAQWVDCLRRERRTPCGA